MYKYVELNSDIYLGYTVLRSKYVYIIKHMIWSFTYEEKLYYYLLVKP